MVIAGPSFFLGVRLRPPMESALPSAPKLGSVMMLLLPPCTETPGTGGLLREPFPAPPLPGYGEIPALADVSEPRPVPCLVAPDPSPLSPLPEPTPLPIPVPPPEPPSPGLSPPPGDIASDPGPPLFGSP